MTRTSTLVVVAMLVAIRPALAQQLLLETQDPEPIGAGRLHFHIESSVAKDEFYPLSGLQGNLWQLPVLGYFATYGLSFAVPVSSQLEIRAEVNGRESTRPGSAPIGTESRRIARFGGRYAVGSVWLDVAVLRGVTRIDPTIGATVGLTCTFEAFSLP